MLKRHRKEREKLDDVLRLPLLVVRFVAFMRISVGSRDCIEISFTSTMVFFISYFLSLSTFSFDETSKCISLFILSLSLFRFSIFLSNAGRCPIITLALNLLLLHYFFSVYFWSMHKILILLSISLPLVLSSSVRDSNILAY